MSLRVIKVTNVGNLCVRIDFNDNTSQTVNIGDFIRQHPHPQYNKYLNEKYFDTFTLEDGNVVWGKNWDLIFPIEQLHRGEILQ